MKNLAALAFLFLIGCTSIESPYPEGYEGPSALIESTENKTDVGSVELFFLEKVNQKKIYNTLTASRHVSQGQGFKFTTTFMEVSVPAIESTFTIVGSIVHGAPVEALVSDNYLVRGEITFKPEAHEQYIVKGSLSADYSVVWLEHKDTGQIIGEKIERGTKK